MKIFKKAFTLTEMIIVVIIIGVLMIALLPRLINIQINARNTGRIYLVKEIIKNLEKSKVVKLSDWVYCSDALYDLYDPKHHHKNYYSTWWYCEGSFPIVVSNSGDTIKVIATMELLSGNLNLMTDEVLLVKEINQDWQLYFSSTGQEIRVNNDNTKKIIKLINKSKGGILNYVVTRSRNSRNEESQNKKVKK